MCAAAALNIATNEVNWDKASVNFKRYQGGDAARQVSESHKVFCKRHYRNFMKTGTVEDAPRSGRPTDVDRVLALEAAAILKAGHWKEVTVKGDSKRTELGLFYYTTVAEAVEKDARLLEIFEYFQFSDRKMLEAMHNADPTLTRITLWSHHEFSVAELDKRMLFGSYMLNLITRDPSIQYLTVFCDESSFVLHGRTQHSVKVYCSSTDTRPSDVCFISDLDMNPITVHFFLAVTANQAFQPKGVVLYEETTGTTDIDRRTNKILDGSTKTGKWVYDVSSCALHIALPNQNVTKGIPLDAALRQLLLHSSNILQLCARRAYVLLSITGCQHNPAAMCSSCQGCLHVCVLANIS